MRNGWKAGAWRSLGLSWIGVFFPVVLALSAARADAPTITVVAAGDVEWSLLAPDRTSRVIYDDGGKPLGEGGWQPVPHLLTPEKTARLKAANDPILARYIGRVERAEGAPYDLVTGFFKDQKEHGLTFASEVERDLYPFRKLAPVFQKADIAFVNLETPLSDTAYRVGYFRTPTHFAEGLKFAGIDVVSLANNHMLDSERAGMFDTIKTLGDAKIAFAGAGANLDAARKPAILERSGIKVAFLSYTQMENSGLIAFATPSRAGVMPMDPDLIRADIAAIRDQVDHVILSFHWDIFRFDVAHQNDVHPEAVSFARAMIDAGADIILGHDPHVPRAVEIYKGKPIFYSLGHLIFSVSTPHWGDNFLARVVLSKKQVERADLIPVAGRGTDLAQPYELKGARAKALVDQVQSISAHLGTQIRMQGDIGVMTPAR